MEPFYSESPFWYEAALGEHIGSPLRVRPDADEYPALDEHAGAPLRRVCAMFKFMDTASETRAALETRTLPAEGKANVPVNVPVNQRRILAFLKANPSATAAQMAELIGATDKTVKRALKALKAAGLLVRVGSDKTGHWEVRADEV